VRGDDEQRGHLFSHLSPEQRVPADHPVRAISVMSDDALRRGTTRFTRRPAGSQFRPSICCGHSCSKWIRCAASEC
jgi:hypothetical protein